MLDQSLYEMIYKRKSFHLYRNIGDKRVSEEEIGDIYQKYQELTPLYPEIKTAIRIVPASEKMLGRGAEYAIQIYSEKKENNLMNVGYLGEQLDLYLASRNLGALWFGIGKTDEEDWNGMAFVIMILIAKVDDAAKFRKNMFKSKRKPVNEIWDGPALSGVTDIARFAPSACNLQPWKVKLKGKELSVYRYRKQGIRGIMPILKVGFYNRIDIGIFLCFLELCLEHEGIDAGRELFVDTGSDQEETLVAKYLLG